MALTDRASFTHLFRHFSPLQNMREVYRIGGLSYKSTRCWKYSLIRLGPRSVAGNDWLRLSPSVGLLRGQVWSSLGIRCQQQQLVNWTCRSNQIIPATDLASLSKGKDKWMGCHASRCSTRTERNQFTLYSERNNTDCCLKPAICEQGWLTVCCPLPTAH